MEDGVELSGEGVVECPHCGQGVEVSMGQEGEVVLCPHCGGEMVVGGEDFEEQAQEEARRAAEEELDGVRIRHLSVARRAAVRARSYAFLAMMGCVFAVVKLGLMTGERVGKAGWDRFAVGYVLFAVAAGMAGVFFGRRVVRLHREVKKPLIEEVEGEPDFSTLSDGSQSWKKLEEMGGNDEIRMTNDESSSNDQ